MKESECIMNAIIIGVILNLVLPLLLKPFATPEEIKPPKGAAALSFKEQLMHMFVNLLNIYNDLLQKYRF